MMAVEELQVKEGAQVMLIKNLGEGSCSNSSSGLATMTTGGGSLVNGSVGVVLGFWTAEDVWGDVGEGKSATGAIRNVKLEDDGKTPCRNIKKETTIGTKDKENVDVKPDIKPNVKAKVKETIELFPLVKFPTPQGTETVLLTREEFRIEDSEGKLLARRMQVCSPCYLSKVFLKFMCRRSRSSSLGQCQFIRVKGKLSTASKWILGRCLRKVCL